MMRKIYKYQVAVSPDPQVLMMPRGYEILSFGEQGGNLFIWAVVDPSAPLVDANILVIGTGWEYDDDPCRFIGTVLTKSGFVWHCFEWHIPLTEEEFRKMLKEIPKEEIERLEMGKWESPTREEMLKSRQRKMEYEKNKREGKIDAEKPRSYHELTKEEEAGEVPVIHPWIGGI